MLDCNRLQFLQSQNVCSSAVPGSVARPNFFGCNTRRGSSGSSACATVMLPVDAACVVSHSASQDGCEFAKFGSMVETYAYSASSALRSRSLLCVELRRSLFEPHLEPPPLEGSQAIAPSCSWVVNWNALIMERASSQRPALLSLWTRLAQQARVQAVQRQHHCWRLNHCKGLDSLNIFSLCQCQSSIPAATMGANLRRRRRRLPPRRSLASLPGTRSLATSAASPCQWRTLPTNKGDAETVTGRIALGTTDAKTLSERGG